MVDEGQAAYGLQLQQQIDKHQKALRRLRRERNDLIAVMRADGASQREVARAMGMTCARVAQLDLARAGART